MVENFSVTCPEEIKAPVLTPRSDRRDFSAIKFDRDHLGRVTDGLVLVSGLWIVSRHGVVPHVIGIDLGNPLFHPRISVQGDDRSGVLGVVPGVFGGRLTGRVVDIGPEKQKPTFLIVGRGTPNRTGRWTVLEGMSAHP